MTRVGIDWQLAPDTGWGVIGLQLLAEFTRRGWEVAYWLGGPAPRPTTTFGTTRCDFPVLRATGNAFHASPLEYLVKSPRNIGLMVFENVEVTTTPEALAYGRRFDALVTASRWNQEVLAAHGIGSTLIHQGVDRETFYPSDMARVGGPLRVFSGGKLEYRKGQDITIAAFRELLTTEPDAVLVMTWYNPWPQLIPELLTSGLVRSVPGGTDAGRMTRWLVSEGIPERNQEHHHASGAELANVIRSCDVAVFPSRAEGATNLAAMECIACGVPTWVSWATGHRDIGDAALGVPTGPHVTRAGWCESNRFALERAIHGSLGDTTAPLPPAFSWSAMVDGLIPLLT